jgi:phosphopantothenate-cysteine ligase
VPLERNTVRFIDNFSAGTRGSASAEYAIVCLNRCISIQYRYFLDAGYAVVFLHRHGSLMPYARRINAITDNLFDLLAKDATNGTVVGKLITVWSNILHFS